MMTVNQIVHGAFYVLLVLSGVTLVCVLIWAFVRARKWEYRTPKVIATWAGICTSVGSFAIAMINFSFPIGVLPESDQAFQAIRTFYDDIQNGKCPEAWDLIHPARKAILKKEYGFELEQFCDAYGTTQIYHNLAIKREDEKDELITSRSYRVSYDVEDKLPRNNIYNLELNDYSDVLASGKWSESYLLTAIVENVRLYFDVPDKDIPVIKEVVSKMPFWSIAAPEMVSEIARLLKLKYKITLAPKLTKPPTVTVKRYFVHSLTMEMDQQDKNRWKIRDGLANPLLVAPYLPRDKLL